MLKLPVLTLLAALTVSASPVLTPPAPQCSVFGIGTANDLTIPYAIWTSPNFFCEQQDKIFSNFNINGFIPSTTTLGLQLQVLGPLEFHLVTFNGNFLLPFAVSYAIAIDLTLQPNFKIVRVSADLSNPTVLGDPTLDSAIFDIFNNPVSTIQSKVLNPGVPVVTNHSALLLLDGYNPNGGAAVSVSNTFVQAEVQQPVSEAGWLSTIGVSLIYLYKRFKVQVA